jgi:hypothetical protein
MGQWSMHIEGHGIHDNGRDDDADAMLKEFVARLGQYHEISAATFTVGGIRDMRQATEPVEVEA